MVDFSIAVCQVDTADGLKHYVTCLPQEHVFARGLISEAIIGALVRPVEAGEPITPATFAGNPAFVDFMHEVIARRGPEQPGLVAEARRQGDGWVYIIDRRTRAPQGHIPPEDIVGGFAVKNDKIVPGSYQPNPRHLILSDDGFFRLGTELEASLLEELANRR